MIKFIDLYSGNDFNPGQLKQDGYIGVIFKLGQGAWADVPRYRPDWWQKAKDFGLLRGGYWLADSRYHSSKHMDEIKAFKVLEDVGELGFWIDAEKPRISMTEAEYWKTPYAGHTNLIDLAYLLTLEGAKFGIYTGPGAYGLVMRDAPKSAHDYLALNPLWTAQYPYKYVEGTSKPDLYGSWTDWTFWQWREGPDVNIFNGTDAKFFERFGSVPTPPTGEVSMYKGTVLARELNIRTGAATTYTQLSKLLAGDKVEASIIIDGWWKLSKIARNGTELPLPAPDCYTYQGATNGYIRLDSFTEPPASTSHVVEVFIDGTSVFRKEL